MAPNIHLDFFMNKINHNYTQQSSREKTGTVKNDGRWVKCIPVPLAL